MIVSRYLYSINNDRKILVRKILLNLKDFILWLIVMFTQQREQVTALDVVERFPR